MKPFLLILLIFGTLILPQKLFGQGAYFGFKRQFKESDFNTDIKGTYNTRNEREYVVGRMPNKGYIALYTPKPQEVLYGNPCVSEYTKDKGFEYLPKEQYFLTHYGETGYHLHSVWVRVLVTFRNGPFWKIRVNQRIKACKQASGDFIMYAPEMEPKLFSKLDDFPKDYSGYTPE